MPDSFKMTNLPFSLLDEKEQKLLKSSLDIGYYQQGEMIMTAGEEPEGVFIIFKGKVGESEVVKEGEVSRGTGLSFIILMKITSAAGLQFGVKLSTILSPKKRLFVMCFRQGRC